MSRRRRNTTMATLALWFLLHCLPSFVTILSAEGTYSNTMLYPVTEEARAARRTTAEDNSNGNNEASGNGPSSSTGNADDQKNPPTGQPVPKSSTTLAPQHKRQPGAPSRYLEYEGPDATYNIRIGNHPKISYPHLEDFPDTEIRLRYQYRIRTSSPKGVKEGVLVVDDCPRHFLWLSDSAVQTEVDHRLLKGQWSERVLVEKAYFTLFYGGTGLASQYMDSVDDFQTDLKGWEIMNRSSDHCEWEGIECRLFWDSEDYRKNSTHVVGFAINGFSLEGTLPKDLYQLKHLRALNLHGNRIQGSLPADWGNLVELMDLDLGDNRLTGTIPPRWKNWRNLRSLRLAGNRLKGRISKDLVTWWTQQEHIGTMPLLQEQQQQQQQQQQQPPKSDYEACDYHEDDDDGIIFADEFDIIEGLQGLDLSDNQFEGSFPMDALLKSAKYLQSLDLSNNRFTGELPDEVVLASSLSSCMSQPNEDDNEESNKNAPQLRYHEDRSVHGGCYVDDDDDSYDSSSNCNSCGSHDLELDPAFEYAGLGNLIYLDLSGNLFGGTFPGEWMKLPSLVGIDFSNNQLRGSLPTQLWNAISLDQLRLSHNQLTGTIPSIEESHTVGQRGWESLSALAILSLDHNKISGTIPYDFLQGLGGSLEILELGANQLQGALPSSIARMTRLEVLDVHGNELTGKLPHEMNQMFPDVRLNLTDNRLIGTIPKLFCGGGAASSNLLFRQFGCDAILCPAGTFHPDGAASLYSGCRPCPLKKGDTRLSTKILGRRQCGDGEDSNRTTFIHGDLNGDGTLSEREVLRLLYTYTLGQNWGLQFDSWTDMTVNDCDLNGVTCVDGKVAKLDLTDATMCMTNDRKAAPAGECKGIPAEISKLTKLEILSMNRRQFLRGTLPTELGELTKLKYIDISSCPNMMGVLPSEIGRLTDLKYLNIGGCRFNGTIPEELFELTNMEKLHLSMNAFTGTLPSAVKKMTKLKEMLLSRTYINGTIPETVGKLEALENFEMYGNRLVGVIPESLGNCTNLKRIDLFNNKLTGTIPESLTGIRALQILHIKLNHLTGTISSGFGKLPSLSWFDVSTNHLHGTIPDSFGNSKTLKDFRLGGGNMIHNPVPKSLCSNTNINGGLTKAYGCSGVICPLGTYSDPGHATHLDGCKPCPPGRTTIYLGSSRCIELTDEDILTMFYDVMAASNSFPVQEKHWSSNREGPICTWNGVECDENETIETIWFPLLELNADVND